MRETAEEFLSLSLAKQNMYPSNSRDTLTGENPAELHFALLTKAMDQDARRTRQSVPRILNSFIHGFVRYPCITVVACGVQCTLLIITSTTFCSHFRTPETIAFASAIRLPEAGSAVVLLSAALLSCNFPPDDHSQVA